MKETIIIEQFDNGANRTNVELKSDCEISFLIRSTVLIVLM